MTMAESLLRIAVRQLHRRGIYPSAAAVKRELGLGGKPDSLNGRQVKWRNDELRRLGYTGGGGPGTRWERGDA